MTIYKTLEKAKILTTDENDEIKKAAVEIKKAA